MSWSYKDVTVFPALFHAVLERALLYAPEPVLLDRRDHRDEANALLEQFRHFRWCIRHPRSTKPVLAEKLSTASIRAEITRQEGAFLIYVRARPTFLSDLTRLNPTLADEFSSIVNEKNIPSQAADRG